ncbi:MAG: Rap1a/Tai family immunity protein [Pseudomonadota bacterium]
MKGIRFFGCSALLVLLALGPSGAAEDSKRFDGNALLKRCTSQAVRTEFISDPHEAFNAGFCLGIVGGVGGVLGFSKEFVQRTQHEGTLTYMEKNGFLKPFCVPSQGLSQAQSARVVFKYLSDHPEELHNDAEKLVATALVQAFPCR